mmetsp:Transcript_47080/g.131301  ORF Transcript_47080/g.131301 Transcript_47080/m.131301 type:complete len:290 (-) Transcript_47080:848-1717(-)
MLDGPSWGDCGMPSSRTTRSTRSCGSGHTDSTAAATGWQGPTALATLSCGTECRIKLASEAPLAGGSKPGRGADEAGFSSGETQGDAYFPRTAFSIGDTSGDACFAGSAFNTGEETGVGGFKAFVPLDAAPAAPSSSGVADAAKLGSSSHWNAADVSFGMTPFGVGRAATTPHPATHQESAHPPTGQDAVTSIGCTPNEDRNVVFWNRSASTSSFPQRCTSTVKKFCRPSLTISERVLAPSPTKGPTPPAQIMSGMAAISAGLADLCAQRAAKERCRAHTAGLNAASFA